MKRFVSKFKLLTLRCSFSLCVFSFSFIALPASAAIVPPECATGVAAVAECGLEAIVGVVVTVVQWIFGIAGSIALLMFLYGGWKWLTSAGSPEEIKKGRDILVQTTIALFIIFGAYTAVQFAIGAIRGESVTKTPWVEGERCVKPGDDVKTGKQGTAFRVGGALTCVTECTDLSADSYARTDLATVKDPSSVECIRGLFPGDGPLIQCCRAAPW